MKGWLGLVSWPVVDGLPTLVVTHQLQVERRTGKVRQSETDVLPLCYTTNHIVWLMKQNVIMNDYLIDMAFSAIHTHTRLTALFPGLPRWAGTRKAQPIWILLKQETVSGSGISWNICKSAPRSRQITTPIPQHSVFYRPDALPAVQPTASKHWRLTAIQLCIILYPELLQLELTLFNVWMCVY